MPGSSRIEDSELFPVASAAIELWLVSAEATIMLYGKRKGARWVRNHAKILEAHRSVELTIPIRNGDRHDAEVEAWREARAVFRQVLPRLQALIASLD